MPLIDYTLPSRLFCFSFSFLLLSCFFMILFLSCSAAQLLSCSVAQLFDCVQRQSKTPAVNHGHGENKSRSPDTGGVHSTADDRTLIKNGCTEHRELGTGTQPSPAQHSTAQLRPDQARRLFNRSLHGQTKSQAQRCQWQEAGALAGAGAVEGGSEEPKNGFYWRVC